MVEGYYRTKVMLVSKYDHNILCSCAGFYLVFGAWSHLCRDCTATRHEELETLGRVALASHSYQSHQLRL